MSRDKRLAFGGIYDCLEMQLCNRGASVSSVALASGKSRTVTNTTGIAPMVNNGPAYRVANANGDVGLIYPGPIAVDSSTGDPASF